MEPVAAHVISLHLMKLRIKIQYDVVISDEWWLADVFGCAIIERSILDGLRYIYYLANGNLKECTFARWRCRAPAWDYEENNQIVNCYVTFANKKNTHSGWSWPTQPKKKLERERNNKKSAKNDI